MVLFLNLRFLYQEFKALVKRSFFLVIWPYKLTCLHFSQIYNLFLMFSNRRTILHIWQLRAYVGYWRIKTTSLRLSPVSREIIVTLGENVTWSEKKCQWFLPASLPQILLRHPFFSVSGGHSLPPFNGAKMTVRVLLLTPTPHAGSQGPQSDHSLTSQSRFPMETKHA